MGFGILCDCQTVVFYFIFRGKLFAGFAGDGNSVPPLDGLIDNI